MLSSFRKKEKSKLYLGAIVVVPRNELKRFDEWGFFKGEPLDDEIREKFEQLFSLPRIPEGKAVNDTDLALEIVVPNIQGGEFTSAQISPFDIPIFWRPKVSIKARLFFINSKKTKASFEVNEKMPWSEYFSRVLSIRGIIRYKPLFDAKELEPMVYKACSKLIYQMSKAV